MTGDWTVFFHYGLLTALSLLGIHGVLFRDHLVKKIFSFDLFQAGLLLLLLTLGSGPGPLNPLCRSMALVVLAVSFASTLALFSLALALHRRYGTFSAAEIARRMRG